MVKVLTKDEFISKVADFRQGAKEWKFLGDKPAIIDFYADWCGPCKALAPVFEELSKEYEGKVDFYKINTEVEQDLSAAFAVRSIPTILFVPLTGQPQIAQGALPKQKFKEIIDHVLLGK